MNEALVIPLVAMAASLGTLLLQALVSYTRILHPPGASEGESLDTPSAGIREKLKRHIGSRGGTLVFSYQVLRFLAGTVLLALTLLIPHKPAPEGLLIQQDLSWVWGNSLPPTDPEILKLSLGIVYVSNLNHDQLRKGQPKGLDTLVIHNPLVSLHHSFAKKMGCDYQPAYNDYIPPRLLCFHLQGFIPFDYRRRASM